MSKLVFVKSLPRETATKISEVTNRGRKKINMTKISRGIVDRFQVLLSEKTGRLKTGLDSLVENPFYQDDNIPAGFEDLKDKEQIMEQYAVEMRFNRKRDSLTNKPYNRHTTGFSEPTFYQTFSYSLNDGTTIFDLDKEKDFLAFKAMLVSKYFANSLREWEQFKFPYAIYYISDAQEDEDQKLKKNQILNKALGSLDYGEANDSETQLKMLKVLLPEVGKGRPTPKQCYNSLTEAIKSNNVNSAGENFITQYNKVLALLNDAAGRSQFEAMVFLQELKNSWVVIERQGAYHWLSKDIIVGNNKAQAVEFLLNPEKQPFHDELKEELENKTAVV